MTTTHKEDLDLLLSLQDRVLETPPASPSAQSPDYLSDHGSPRAMSDADMEVLRNVFGDYIDESSSVLDKAPKLKQSKNSNDVDVERFSGLRIRSQVVSNAELGDQFSDIRFIRLQAIRNSLVGDTISGCWATAGVLTEKGNPRVSSNGKNYCIWKLGFLDEDVISVFLFGDAYTSNWKEQVGTIFALTNASVRKDGQGKGFSLSVFSSGQILKMGTSIDYGVCKAKRKDGTACTVAINKRRGVYCKYHTSTASQKYSVTRAELKGGNLRTAFRAPYQPEGIYMVERKKARKSMQPMKVMSVDGLKKALSNAGKVTTNTRSQGIRFLTEVTGKMHAKDLSNESVNQAHQKSNSEKRLSSSMKLASTMTIKNQPGPKRRKTAQATGKMIELELVSSDEE